MRQLHAIAVASLLQIKKAIRRKHTLPSYKMRVKPFFGQLGVRPTSPSSSRPADGQRLLPATAIVTAIVASRLPASAASASRAFYCALALGKPLVTSLRSVRHQGASRLYAMTTRTELGGSV